VQSWEKDLPTLLTFLKYPSAIRSVIYTTNWIERTIKEIKKRLRPMNSLPDVKAPKKSCTLLYRISIKMVRKKITWIY
ncbi:transposase-like protein, partial [Caldalkalibacillus uzonensis]|nr:transposase-like protein [Caldalkalibacillus uzonensis]